jgi:hypothetical protein
MHAFFEMRKLVRPAVLAAALWTLLPPTHAEEIEVTGELLVVYADDFANHRADVLYLLQDHRSGRTVRLRTREEQAPREWRTGTRLKVRGQAATGNEEVVLAANGTGVEVLEVASAAVAGQRPTLVILLNFQNAPNECTPAGVSNLVFGATSSVDGLYQEMSNGGLWFTGTVVGPYTINYNSSGNCDYTAWANAADAAATAAGIQLSQFQHKVYVLPKRNPCSWAGLGTVGGNPSRAWIGLCDVADVYAHELGHNLGMHHSATDANNDGAADCEYCDNSDIMGYAGPGLRWLNGPHLDQMGWLETGKVVTVTADTTLNLAPLALEAAATPYPQLFKITKPGTAAFYYVSYRRALGYDAKLGASYLDRASVHHFAGGSAKTHLIAALSDNGSFVDAGSGFTIRQLSHNNDFVTLQIGFSCTPAAPTISLTPPATSVAPGTNATFTVNIINNDSAACAASTFQLAPVGPAGWPVAVNPASVTLHPGQATSVTLTVPVPVSAAPGNYSVGVSVSDNFQTLHAQTVTRPCTVVSTNPDGDTTPPSAPGDLVAVSLKKRVLLSWLPATDDRGVAAYRVYRDGVWIAATTKVSFADRRVIRGVTYAYYVTAVDAAGNESAPSNVTSAAALARKPKQ